MDQKRQLDKKRFDETDNQGGGGMTPMDFHELKTMTVAQLRGVAKEVEGLTGSSQMRKDALLKDICKHLRLDMHEHHEVVGVDKASIKKRIRELKTERDTAIMIHNHQDLKDVRRQIHKLKRKIHQATV
jgi:hypothetical protein